MRPEVRSLKSGVRGLKPEVRPPIYNPFFTMELSLRTLRFRLQAAGLLPRTRLARAACYFLGLDLLLFARAVVVGCAPGQPPRVGAASG